MNQATRAQRTTEFGLPGILVPATSRGCVVIGTGTYESQTIVASHVHRYPYAVVVADGDVTTVQDGVPQRRLSRAAAVREQTTPHAMFYARRTQTIEIELVRESGRALHLRSDDGPIDAFIDATYACLTNPQNASLDALRAALEMLFAEEHVPHATPPTWLTDSLASFAWTSARPIRDAANEAGVHASHFVRTFKQSTGMTPQRFRRQRQIERASQLLLASEATLAEIAAECGFSDQSHFTNAFTRETALAPGRFRMLFRRGI